MRCVQLRSHLLPLAILLGAMVVGCGGGIDLAGVSGTATHKGEPVQDLLVVFVPEEGRISSGMTDAQGHFTLQFTRDEEGVIPGKHRVYVKYVPSDMDVRMAIEQRKSKLPPQIREILTKYGDPDKSPLTFDIQKSQEIDLKLD